MLQAALAGGIAKVSYRRPATPTADLSLRAGFLACLARGAAGPQFDGRRIEILGAWVQGRLNLVDAAVPMSLWFYRCHFDTTPLLDGARITGSLGFPDCSLPGLRAEACSIAGDLALNAGCAIRGDLRLARAVIGRDLDCERLVLRAPGRDPALKRRPFVADGVRIGGNLVLGDGFEADGEVRLVGARIAGDLRIGKACLGANLCPSGARGAALNLDRVNVAGHALLNRGLSAAGAVRLNGARIEGDLDFSGAEIDRIGDATWDESAALSLVRANVGGTLVLREQRLPLRAATLADAQVGALADDASTWGERLVLDGLRYRRLAPGAPTDAEFRHAWLAQQVPAHLDDDFRPAPWRRLIRVLRRHGDHESARRLAIAREQHLRAIGRVGRGLPGAWRALSNAAHAAYGLAAGYGHRPQRLLAMLALTWASCAFVYLGAAERGAMAPRSSFEARPAAAAAAADADFNPFVYSLDLMLPLVDLRQARGWAAVGATGTGREAGVDGWRIVAGTLAWIESLLGGVLCLGLVVALSGLSDRDRRA